MLCSVLPGRTVQLQSSSRWFLVLWGLFFFPLSSHPAEGLAWMEGKKQMVLAQVRAAMLDFYPVSYRRKNLERKNPATLRRKHLSRRRGVVTEAWSPRFQREQTLRSSYSSWGGGGNLHQPELYCQGMECDLQAVCVPGGGGLLPLPADAATLSRPDRGSSCHSPCFCPVPR